ncbi:MAG: class I SAM-dependent methyltransferase [Mycobacteriales bacterium]
MAFLVQVAGDAGAALGGMSVSLGDRFGLYGIMAGAGALTSEQLAARAGLHERYIREWLAGQAALGYVEYDPATKSFTLPAVHAAVLADPMAPTYLAGAFQMLSAVYTTEDDLYRGFRDGTGVGWDEHSDALYSGTAKLFRPGYLANLVAEWLPAMEGVMDKLRNGALVADVGCGFGHSTLILADAFPESTVVGFDYHQKSIDVARQLATEGGHGDNVRFEVAAADAFAGSGYDLVTCFDCVHDMGDPAALASRVRSALDDDGTWMLVEPNATGRLEEDLQSPFAKMFMGASTVVCLPSAIAQNGPEQLGNHAGEDAMRAIVMAAGFSRWRRATENPINAVFEARP